MYPADFPPEQPEHDCDFAPLDNVPDSPSYCFSSGPADDAPVLGSKIQFTAFLTLAVDPEILRGNQIYVLRIKLSLTHLSPMYTKLPFPIGSTKVVWLAYVFDPESANFFHPDHGPEREVAVE